MQATTHSLHRLLAKSNLGLSPERLAAATKEAHSSGKSLIHTLVDLKIVDEGQLLKELSRLLHVPLVNLATEEIDPQAVSSVPAKVVQHYSVMPLSVANGQLQVAMDDPLNYELIDELTLVLGRTVKPVLAQREEIAKAIRRHYGVGAETIERLVAEEDESVSLEAAGEGQKDLAQESQAQQASVIKLVNQVLMDAIRERATDVHLEPYEDELRVRYRVDGVLREAGVPPAARHFRAAIVSRVKIMASLDIAEKRMPQDGRAQVKLADQQFDLRISILPVAEGEGVNIRILPRKGIFHDFSGLGLEGEDLVKVEALLEQPHGIVLVTGPTGSGKTTTLYAALSRLNKPQNKILTIEDPIEYRIRGLQQMQVAPEIGFTFARALRSMLRHDPDIMLIGEIRDTETAEIAIRTALTGHLVFSTLHTNDAAGAVNRLTDMGIQPYLISSSVLGMVAQRLVRTICPHCREPIAIDDKMLENLKSLSLPAPADMQLFHGRGCEHCRLSGYRGRTAIYEIVLMSQKVRQLTQASRPAHEIKAAARKEGMRTLREAGWARCLSGATTLEEVLRVTQEDAGDAGDGLYAAQEQADG